MGAMVGFLAIFCESADRDAVLNQIGAVSAQDNLDGTLGLDEVQGSVLLVGLGVQALAEYSEEEDDDDFTSVEYTPDRCPGDLGFDPLSLCAVSNPNGFELKGVHNIEVNTGRLAMIGLTSFLLKEFVIKDLWARGPLVQSSEVCCNTAHRSVFVAPFQTGRHFSASSNSQQAISCHEFSCASALLPMISSQVMDVPLSRRNLGRLSL